MERGIKTEELLKKYSSYREGYDGIQKQVEQGKLVPVKSSGSNEKRPWLYNRYQVVASKKDLSRERAKLMKTFPAPMDPSYYMRHLRQYEKDRPYVEKIITFFNRDDWEDLLSQPVSLNERSFQIFSEEKFLKQHKGFCSRIGLELSFFNVYETDEPMAYFSQSKRTPQCLLILENLDPYISLKRKMVSAIFQPLGYPVETLIYGGGKRIFTYWRDLELFGEPCLKEKSNTFYYFGDLDYEGIAIYENLKTTVSDHDIRLFAPAYLKMLEKARNVDLPRMKDQKPVDGELFFESFDEDAKREMKDILVGGRYIPQEILNITDYEKGEDDAA